MTRFFAERRKHLCSFFIHGGYWQSLDKSDFSYVARPFLSNGVNVAIVNYRLAPHVKMVDIVHDNQAAVAWLHKNAGELGFSAEKLFISGHSAGGHLTAVLAGTDWTRFGSPANAVKGGCAISGLYDLEPIRLCYLNRVLGLTEKDVALFSPLRISRAAKVPLILTVGGDESPSNFRLQREFEHRLREEDSLLEVVDLKRGHHFDAVDWHWFVGRAAVGGGAQDDQGRLSARCGRYHSCQTAGLGGVPHS